MPRSTAWPLLIMANVLFCGVLSLYQPGIAAQPAPARIANPIEQRAEMLDELRQIRELLKAQNELLRGGNLRVVVAPPDARP